MSNVRSKTISLTNKIDTLQIDTLSIVPESFQILTDTVSPNQFKVDYSKAQFIKLLPIELNQIQVQYRVYPFYLAEKTKTIEEYVFDNDGAITEQYQVKTDSEEIFEFGNLDVQGGLGRSLNFGNNQNLVVNSNLNLRLNGELSNGIQIVGALTDENLPFEPQGTSSQIRELDKVFLQFLKDVHQITLGDYEQRPPNSYFLQYNKRLQGINYSGSYLQDKDWKADVNASGAVARGKYTRNQFVGGEGNQGPYKLFGANNESFIIILAGTERVFIDGVQMQRGRDYDYVIDYNTGEITFTNNRFITNRSRISVEFEYKDQLYNTTFLNTEANYGNDKLNFRFNLYTQQDAKRSANFLNEDLNTDDIFAQAGEADDFFVDSFYEPENNTTRTLYRIAVDTTINGTLYEQIFIASETTVEQLYVVNFTFVGAGNGDYVVANEIVNGRVYEFVPRINNIAQGSFVAKQRVTPPSQQQLFTLTTSYEPNKHHEISVETALSNRDINTLSEIGNEDNQGFGSRIVWKSNYNLGSDSLKNILSTELNYEFKQNQFRPIERYRPVEFTRDWNLALNEQDSLQEHYANLIVNFAPNAKQSIQYQLSNFTQQNEYQGIKQFGQYRFQANGYQVEAELDYLTADEDLIKSNFIRPSLLASKEINGLNGLKAGVSYEENKREFRNTTTNLLDLRSIGDKDVRVFVESQDTSKIYSKLSVGKHYDSTPNEEELVSLFEANVVELNGRLNQLNNHQLNWNFTYRDLEVINPELTEQQDKLSFLGNINYSAQLLQGAITTGFDYEVGSGQEPKREFSYLQVANGQGQYTWIDYNENNEQEITEFEVSPFSDQANYVRVFTTSNEYINAESVRLNQWVNINPAVSWRSEEGIKALLSKFSVNSLISTDRRVFENSSTSQFNPYLFNVNQQGLLAATNQVSNKIIYNKLSNQFRVVYLNQNRNNKNQLLSGFEERENRVNELTADVFLKNKMTLQTKLVLGDERFFAENYAQKNFDFTFYSIQPRITWILNDNLRIGGNYELKKSENIESLGGEDATSNALDFDFNFNKTKLFALQGNMEFNKVSFNGEENSAVQFSMLNGLQRGNNLLWNLNFEREVAKAVKINLIYDGRSLGNSDPVHTGRARITALFN